VSIESTKKLEFCERVRTWRESAGLTQEQLAAKLGISRNYVYLLESNQKTASRGLVARFEMLESGKLTDEMEEDSLPYRAEFKLQSLNDAELQRLIEVQAAELKIREASQKKYLLESICALAHEMERRL